MRQIPEPELNSETAWKSLLGRRVSLRFRTGDPRRPFNEAVGAVRAVSEGKLVLLTRRGEDREVPISDIEVAKQL